MRRPEITVTDKQVVVVTEAYRLHVEFIYVPERVHEPPPDPSEDFMREIKDQQSKWKRYAGAPKAPPSIPPIGGKDASAQAKKNYSDKICKMCGVAYSPKGPAQQFCPACKPQKKGKRLEELDGEDLDKTLAEIEERRKKPYSYNK